MKDLIKTQKQFFGTDANKPAKAVPGTIYWAYDIATVYVYDYAGDPQAIGGGGSSYDGISESGTGAGGDLLFITGDHAEANNGTRIEIDDAAASIKLIHRGGGITLTDDYYNGTVFNFTDAYSGASAVMDMYNNPNLILTGMGIETDGSITSTSNGGSSFRDYITLFDTAGGNGRILQQEAHSSTWNTPQNKIFFPYRNASRGYVLQGIAVDPSPGTYANSGAAAPSSDSDTGVAGEVRYDASFRYDCIRDNVWVRSAITTSF